MTLKLVCDLRGHRSDLKWPQKVNITRGGVTSTVLILETRFFACAPHLQYPILWKKNWPPTPGGRGRMGPPQCNFLKVVRYSHVAYQMKALEKCYKNMTLKLVCDLRVHRSDLKWPQKLNITKGDHVHSFDTRNAIFCMHPSFAIP